MTLYTAYCNYFATGEGNTHMVLVRYAADAEGMKKQFIDMYGDWYAIGAVITEGLTVCSPVLEQPMIDFIQRTASRGGMVDYNCMLHVNFS